jgi:hypothetical protein
MLLALSCVSSPKPPAEAQPQPSSTTATPAPPIAPPIQEPVKPEPSPPPPEAPNTPSQPVFDAANVTEEVRTATFVDVRSFIESLNEIIRNKDYDSWRSHLSDAYINYYSDPKVLAEVSEFPIIKRKGIKLETLRDYFINVVYPSRQNDKVDDIEFVSEKLVKAITVSPKGDRNILYMLEKHGDAWKIGIGR